MSVAEVAAVAGGILMLATIVHNVYLGSKRR